MQVYFFELENKGLAAYSRFSINEMNDDWARIKGREIAATMALGTTLKITTVDCPGCLGTVATYRR